MIKLEVIKGPQQGRTFTFDGHDNFIVGRADCAHFRLPQDDRCVSRVHFLIEVNPPLCHVTDLGSRNGTGVNGVRVDRADLKHGDLIQAGSTVLRLHCQGPALSNTVSLPASERAIGTEPLAQEQHLPDTIGHDPELIPPTVDASATPARAMVPLPQLERYRIERELGRGGMGVVYLAQQLPEHVAVAVKLIRPAVTGSEYQIECFLREVRILSQLQHPGIVGFEESGKAGELLYFAMEYVPGTDASREVKKYKRVAVGPVVRLICQTLEALQYAHDAGFVHRDVKPSNLLLSKTPSGTVCKLADFGLARAYNASPLSGLTMMGDIGGTLPFMPPEQITDYRHTNPAADQYATAATLYQLLTGRYIFDFDDSSSTRRISTILCEPHTPIAARRDDIPDGLSRVLDRALEKEPTKRFPDATAFREALWPYASSRSP